MTTEKLKINYKTQK